MTGAAVAAFSVGVAKMPHGDAKTTGAEGKDTTDSSSDPSSGIPTTVSSGRLGGPLKDPSWSHAAVYADFLALSGNTLLVQGATLTAFDPAAGTQRWTAPRRHLRPSQRRHHPGHRGHGLRDHGHRQ